MKKLIYLLILLVILAAAAYMVLLNKPEIVLTGDRVTKYVEQFNKNNPDFQISLKKENIKISKTGKGTVPEFNVSVKDAELKYTLKGLVKTMQIPEIDYEDIPDVNIIEKADETNLIINPVKKYIGYKNTKNLQINISDKNDYADFNSVIKYINGNNLNISPLFFSDNKTLENIYAKMMILNPSFKLLFKDFSGEVIDKKSNNDKIKKVTFNINNISLKSNADKELLEAIYGKPKNIDFNFLFKQKVRSSSFELNKFQLAALNKNNKKEGELSLESIKASGTINSGSKENTIKMDFKYSLENCKFKNFDKENQQSRDAEAFLNVNKINFNIKIDSLSINLVKIYLNIIKEIREKYGNDPEMAQEVFKEHIQEIKTAFYETEPVLKINLLPFEHLIGKFEFTSEFKFVKGAMFPIGKAKAIIYNLPQVENNLLKYKLATPQNIDEQLKFVKKYYKKQTDGNYIAEFEIIKSPPFFMLNGKPFRR